MERFPFTQDQLASINGSGVDQLIEIVLHCWLTACVDKHTHTNVHARTHAHVCKSTHIYGAMQMLTPMSLNDKIRSCKLCFLRYWLYQRGRDKLILQWWIIMANNTKCTPAPQTAYYCWRQANNRVDNEKALFFLFFRKPPKKTTKANEWTIVQGDRFKFVYLTITSKRAVTLTAPLPPTRTTPHIIRVWIKIVIHTLLLCANTHSTVWNSLGNFKKNYCCPWIIIIIQKRKYVKCHS